MCCGGDCPSYRGEEGPVQLTTGGKSSYSSVRNKNLGRDVRKARFLTLPPPGVCFKLSLEPQRAWMLEKSTFLSRIWTCRVREGKEENVFRKDNERRREMSPKGGGQVSLTHHYSCHPYRHHSTNQISLCCNLISPHFQIYCKMKLM